MKSHINIILPLGLVALLCFAPARTLKAVDPAPDGGYAGGNTAEGDNALFSLTTSGEFNTAIGADALYSSRFSKDNTAVGYRSLYSSLAGGNTAIGSNSLFSNTRGGVNTAVGFQALMLNTIGNYNTATGVAALSHNQTGSGNTADGFIALELNLTGSQNTATGYFALVNNHYGNYNTASGAFALRENKGGDNNTAIGFNALTRNFSGSNNIAVGASAGANLTFGYNNIDIGNTGVTGEKATIRLGTEGTHSATFIAGIHGVTTATMDAVPVVIDSAGQLGTISSSERFKKDIKPMDNASEAILALKPVTFHYKKDTTSTAQFGLIAEEVAKVDPDLAVRDENGQIYSVRYEAVNAMLLNEFLKEHHKVEEQAATIAQLKTTARQQQKQIEALTAAVQKVSDRLERETRTPQLVANDQ